MRIALISTFGAAALLLSAAAVADEATGEIQAAVDNPARADANRARDEARKPAKVLTFAGVKTTASVLDFGSGGGYYAELFSGLVGANGKVYAHNVAGERFEGRRAGLEAQYAPFGNIEMVTVESGAALPLADSSVDAVMLSYIYHHLHYSEESGEALPQNSAALLGEFKRVLKPGGKFIVIEHVAAEGSSRVESAGWHRTPPATAKADITGAGFEFAGEAPDIYFNADDDLKNVWFDTGLSGKTTSFVHKYKKPAK